MARSRKLKRSKPFWSLAEQTSAKPSSWRRRTVLVAVLVVAVGCGDTSGSPISAGRPDHFLDRDATLNDATGNHPDRDAGQSHPPDDARVDKRDTGSATCEQPSAGRVCCCGGDVLQRATCDEDRMTWACPADTRRGICAQIDRICVNYGPTPCGDPPACCCRSDGSLELPLCSDGSASWVCPSGASMVSCNGGGRCFPWLD